MVVKAILWGKKTLDVKPPVRGAVAPRSSVNPAKSGTRESNPRQNRCSLRSLCSLRLNHEFLTTKIAKEEIAHSGGIVSQTVRDDSIRCRSTAAIALGYFKVNAYESPAHAGTRAVVRSFHLHLLFHFHLN